MSLPTSCLVSFVLNFGGFDETFCILQTLLSFDHKIPLDGIRRGRSYEEFNLRFNFAVFFPPKFAVVSAKNSPGLS